MDCDISEFEFAFKYVFYMSQSWSGYNSLQSPNPRQEDTTAGILLLYM